MRILKKLKYEVHCKTNETKHSTKIKLANLFVPEIRKNLSHEQEEKIKI